jgi:hemolysin D
VNALRREADSAIPAHPRAVLYVVAALVFAALAWAAVARLDVVAVAHGKIVPQGSLQIVQPAEAGILRDILVKEGERVRAEQVLARMDSSVSDADSRQLRTDLQWKSVQLARIDAELSGEALVPAAGADMAISAQVQAQFLARRQAHRDALESERAVVMKAEQDLRSAMEIESKLQRTLPIYEQQEQAFDKLTRDGFAGRLMLLERQRDRIEKEQDLAAQRHAIASLKALIAQGQKRITQLESAYRQQLQNERIEASAQLLRLREDIGRHSHRRALLELRAPQSGIVKDLATRTTGSVVAAGTVLMTLVPADGPLQAEVWVSNPDAGVVRVGQAVKLKLMAYPFQRHGLVDGEVVHVSPDSSDATASTALDHRGAVPGGSAVATAFRTLVALRKPYIESGGARLALGPGMQVSAEMHLGTRSVLDYLLSPLQRTVHEAAREP